MYDFVALEASRGQHQSQSIKYVDQDKLAAVRKAHRNHKKN